MQPVNDGSDYMSSNILGVQSPKQDGVAVPELLEKLSEIAVTETAKQVSVEKTIEISRETGKVLWETSSALSDSRPPGDLCVYNKNGDTSEAVEGNNDHIPPIFDGSVANATPPPLGGAPTGASGGAGTVLHLACAMDSPFILAFLLIMGADGRATHTAFRRLMIHEAACNGSVKCLALLLSVGKELMEEANEKRELSSSSIPFFPDSLSLPAATSLTGHSTDLSPSIASFPMNIRHFRRDIIQPRTSHGDFLAALAQFRRLSQRIQAGELNELEAARAVMKSVTLSETTRSSIIRSCTFKSDGMSSRTFLGPYGCADGHGNTPLHWAAFKNETKCVSLLLEFNANPNARAHPSGWTPLHDAAYSNSSDSIELLVGSGAKVDARANSGATPLCFAAQEDASDAARLLLKRGADLTARCAGSPEDGSEVATMQHPHSRFSGYTPLHYCAHYNAHKASQILLADPSSKAAMETSDLSGRLPIHVAVARGSSDVLRELLHAGARIDIRPSDSENRSPRTTIGPNAFFALPDAPPQQQRPPSPEVPESPNRNRIRSRSSSTSSPVTSPVLRSLIPEQPVNSTKPWNCLTQQAIDECKDLICKAEQSWSPDRHLLFTPQDRKAVMELLRVGKRLEQQGVLFVDLWPQVLGFCGRGWFDPEQLKPQAIDFVESEEESSESSDENSEGGSDVGDDHLAMPSLGST